MHISNGRDNPDFAKMCEPHTIAPMQSETVANVIGAFAQAVADAVQEAVSEGSAAPPSAAAALVHLSKYRDEPIDALRRPLGLSHPGCVRLVDRLEERRLVLRSEGSDRRSRPLRLTAAGETLARGVLRKRRGALKRALGALTPAEQRTLARLAGKVLTEIVRNESHALAVCRVCDYDACPDADCPVTRALAP
jgi:MarR family transcriptional regulator, negative regulator of the multidrug operon emrRAB